MDRKSKPSGQRTGSLLENTVMLYILSFSNMALAMVTQGYQTRVLGTGLIGTLGAVQSATNFFQTFIDFGFIMSATAKISQHREDKDYLNRILTCVVAAKTLFMLISFAILFLFIRPGVKDPTEFLVYVIFLFSTCMASFLPDFMYRGLEQMRTITVRAVAIRVFATLMIFLFIKQPSDYWKVPLFTAIGNGGALIFVYWHLFSKVGLRFVRPTVKGVWQEIKESSHFFLSKVAVAVNTNLNSILLKNIIGPIDGGISTGRYTNADKVIVAARSGMTPIGDSLYPHMMKHRNFNIIRKAMLLIYPVILLGCAVVFLFAEPLLVLWLGPAGKEVVLPLRLLIPTAVFTFPNYVLGYPTLGAMGLSKFANISVVFGTFVYLIGIAFFWFTWGINLVTLCILTSSVEFSILAFRVTVIIKNRSKMKPQPEEEKA